MSSSLSNSSAITCVSAATSPELSNHGATLVSYLSTSIKMKPVLSGMDINPGNSPHLENIRAEISSVPEDTYQAFKDIVAIADSYHSELQKLLIRAKNNEPIHPNTLQEYQESMGNDGIVKVFNAHHAYIKLKIDFIDETLDSLDLSIRTVFEESEKKHRELGQVDAVRDNIVPGFSAINPILAPAESAGKVAVGLIAYNIFCEVDNKLKELGIVDKSLRENVLTALQTRSNLEGYRNDNNKAIDSWLYGCETIYRKDSAGAEVNIQLIEVVIKRMVTFISPIKEYLVQINPYYGPGITVNREAKIFCDAVPKLYQYINMIGSAKVIIRSSHRRKFEETVTELGLAIYEYLASMRDVFNQKPTDPAKLEQFVKPKTLKFLGDTKVSIHQLEKMLDKHISGTQSKDAKKKRGTGDRAYNSMQWRNRPLVDSDGVRAHLMKVDAAIDAIYGLTVASLGKILGTVDGQIERVHVKLAVTNPTLGEAYQVMNEHIDKGLNRFRGYQMKEAPSSRIQRMFEGLRSNHKAC